MGKDKKRTLKKRVPNFLKEEVLCNLFFNIIYLYMFIQLLYITACNEYMQEKNVQNVHLFYFYL